MQQILSLRFLATLVALVGVFMALLVVFGRGDSGASTVAVRPMVRDIHLLEAVLSAESEAFGLRSDGRSRGELSIGLRDGREMRIVEGTFGENQCGQRIVPGRCAVAANLLGDAVVWFALLPVDAGQTVTFPAIDELEDGRARLVNGWRLPYARVLDRRCPVEFSSYREFRRVLGDRFDAIYSLEAERLVAVVCHSQ